MRSVLIGAVGSTEVALDGMVRAGVKPDLLVTLPPERHGRHSDFVDLAAVATTHGVPVLYAANINDDEALEGIGAVQPDYVFVIGWSQLCGPRFLSVARIGTIGYHPAPLPRLRGRAVIPWTILLREPRTGSTLFWIDDGVDSGSILRQQLFDVAPDETAWTLCEKHMAALTSMMPSALEDLQSDQPTRMEQDHRYATYCAKRIAEDGLIDWRQPADDVLCLIRAVGQPYPGAFTFQGKDKLLAWAARPFADSASYVGLPGQIQLIKDGNPIVRCGDGECIELTDWQMTGDAKPKIHTKLRETA